MSPGRCKLDRSCAYSIDEDTLEAQVQLARLPLVPEQFRDRIIIELGANTVFTVRDTLLKQPKFPHRNPERGLPNQELRQSQASRLKSSSPSSAATTSSRSSRCSTSTPPTSPSGPRR